MPAPVPPGFTRGPILLIGRHTTPHALRQLYQRFWIDAGSYGARILILPTAPDVLAEHLAGQFLEWEADTVRVYPVLDRHSAQQEQIVTAIDQATAILLLNRDPLQFARNFGGTRVAQAIRRANARNKCVGAVGPGATVLCQHMLLFDAHHAPYFAPGLGLINRLGIDVQTESHREAQVALNHLLAAVLYNPFLVGVGLGADTGVVLYSDTTLEVFGEGEVLLVDAVGLTEVCSRANIGFGELAAIGVQAHWLTAGCTFNFDQRTAQRPTTDDLPSPVTPATSKSSF